MKIFFNFWLTKFFHSIKHTKVSTGYRVFQLLKNAGFHSTRPAKASTRQHPQICQRYVISIHETHKGLDSLTATATKSTIGISIHETHKGLDSKNMQQIFS